MKMDQNISRTRYCGDFWIQKQRKYCRFWIQNLQKWTNRFLDPEIEEMVRFLDPEIVEMVERSFMWGCDNTKYFIISFEANILDLMLST